MREKLGRWKGFILIMGSDTSAPTLKQRRKKRKRSSWIGREKSCYPIITGGLGNSRYHKPGSHTKEQQRTWRKYSFLHFFWMTDQGTWKPSPSAVCVSWLGRVSGRIRERLRGYVSGNWDAELCCQCCVITVHLPVLFLAFLVHTGRGTTVSPYLK